MLEDKTYEDALTLRKWSHVLRVALEQDSEETACVIVQMATSPLARDSILELHGNSLLNMLSLLQGVSHGSFFLMIFSNLTALNKCLQLVDRKCTNYRFLERLMIKLMRNKGVVPPELLVQGVIRLGTSPEGGGGFADVWKGRLSGKIVALKVLRLFGRPEHRAAALEVSETSLFPTHLDVSFRNFAKKRWSGDGLDMLMSAHFTEFGWMTLDRSTHSSLHGCQTGT